MRLLGLTRFWICVFFEIVRDESCGTKEASEEGSVGFVISVSKLRVVARNRRARKEVLVSSWPFRS
jgi:hypothetical protein